MKTTVDKIRTIIIDDEPVARQRIADLLLENKLFTVVGEFENGLKAQSFYNSQEVDLMFVDIKMPKLDGMSLVKSIEKDKRPFIIFITAYDEFAIDAFNLFAIDYILKPYTKQRFRETLNRVTSLMHGQIKYNQRNQLDGLFLAMENKTNKSSLKEKISVKLGNKIYFIFLHDIEYIIASGNYLEVFAKNKLHVIRQSMSSMLSKLPSNFKRNHKSTIVNTNFVSEIIALGQGNYELKMKNNKLLKISNTYKKDLFESMNV